MQLRWQPVVDHAENCGVHRGALVELVRCAKDIIGLGHLYTADRHLAAAMCH
jgi:hypothetical protein